MDPLSEILSSMRIRKAGFTRLTAQSPWGLQSDGLSAIQFVLVVDGSGILIAGSNANPIPLSRGDVFIILGNEPYRLFDREGSPLAACVDVEAMRVGNQIKFGGDGPATTFVCGFFEIDQLDVKPLMGALPKLLSLRMEESRTLAFQSVLELLESETASSRLGSEAATTRLFELLFIHAVRSFTQEHSLSKGWLAGMSDRNVSLAIEAFHSDPRQAWTVDKLAKVARMSRSAFAVRFRQTVGQPPLAYLTEWRIYKATRLLEKNTVRISDVARTVGYASEAAFTKAFIRLVGSKPSDFRRANILRKATGTDPEAA